MEASHRRGSYHTGADSAVVRGMAEAKPRKGINPFTKQEEMPVRKVINVRPLKGLNNMAM